MRLTDTWIWLAPLWLLSLDAGAFAAEVEVIKAPSAQVARTPPPKDHIVLTFGPESIIIRPLFRPGAGEECLRPRVSLEELSLLRDRRPAALRRGYETIYQRHGFQVVRVLDPAALAKERESVDVEPIRESRRVLVSAHQVVVPDPAVEAVLDLLSTTVYEEYMRNLAELGSRYTCTAGAKDAQHVIESHFQGLGLASRPMAINGGCLSGLCNEVAGFNVVGVKKGSTRPDEIILVAGHYDSTSPVACRAAPGANDNASGAAGVMELARVFAGLKNEATLLFVVFSGEEQGLLGSKRFAQFLARSGLQSQVKGFVVLDMISYWVEHFGVLLEGSNAFPGQSAFLANLADLATAYTDLAIESSTSPAGSDHVPLLLRGIPGALAIEMDWSLYPYYHTVDDTMAHQNSLFGTEVLKLAAAMLATFGGVTQ